MLRPSLKWWT